MVCNQLVLPHPKFQHHILPTVTICAVQEVHLLEEKIQHFPAKTGMVQVLTVFGSQGSEDILLMVQKSCTSWYGSLSHYLQGLGYIQGGCRNSEPSTVSYSNLCRSLSRHGSEEIIQDYLLEYILFSLMFLFCVVVFCQYCSIGKSIDTGELPQ